MLLPDWSSMYRVLVAWDDRDSSPGALIPALRFLQQALPQARTDLLAMAVKSSGSLEDCAPLVAEVLVRPWPWHTTCILTTISLIARRMYHAVLIFSGGAQSSYPLAYMCYLACVPVRVGFAREFGGGVLSLWFQPAPGTINPEQRYLSLLHHAGLVKSGVCGGG